MQIGIENLIKTRKEIENFALVSNYGSVDSHFNYSWELLKEKYGSRFKKLFSPQHGLWGTEQANMIETESRIDENLNLKIVSLYSETRKPKNEDLKDVETIIIDLQDVGSKYYTYIYTMALCLVAANENDKKVIILDRPNPLTGIKCYGNLTKLKSFVGMYEIPIVHGMTIGELAKLFNEEFEINCNLEVIKMTDYDRRLGAGDKLFNWVPISPNMPYPQTAFVYPGACLLEGTNISEGRGTTRPFEIIGAPFINSKILINELKKENLPGARFREISFRPTFDKFYGEVCNGLFVHVTDFEKFNAYLTYITIIKSIYKLYQKDFKWASPPYEYEYKELPFDILSGDHKIREMIEKNETLEAIDEFCNESIKPFIGKREKYLLY